MFTFLKFTVGVAEYRRVAEGTTCEACRTHFWTVGRLAAHLRASQGCVATLQAQGKWASSILPGFGSRKRRKTDSVEYTLAVPTRLGVIPPSPDGPVWSREQKSAYEELCDLLLSATSDHTVTDLTADITAVLRSSPLYPDEISSICDLITKEIQELHADDPRDPWEPEVVRKMHCALAKVVPSMSEGSDQHAATTSHLHSLTAFQSLLDTFDWQSKISGLQVEDGTQTTLSFSLLPRWEAEWRQQCRQVGTSAVIDDVGILLPEDLRRAWNSLLEGRTVVIHAPPDFWKHPLAQPFICLRAVTCTP